jgi:DNA primase
LLLKGTDRDPLGRANAINEIADTVADIPDAVKRETYIDFLARKFDIRRTALEDRVSSTRAKLLTKAPPVASRPYPGKCPGKPAPFLPGIT